MKTKRISLFLIALIVLALVVIIYLPLIKQAGKDKEPEVGGIENALSVIHSSMTKSEFEALLKENSCNSGDLTQIDGVTYTYQASLGQGETYIEAFFGTSEGLESVDLYYDSVYGLKSFHKDGRYKADLEKLTEKYGEPIVNTSDDYHQVLLFKTMAGSEEWMIALKFTGDAVYSTNSIYNITPQKSGLMVRLMTKSYYEEHYQGERAVNIFKEHERFDSALNNYEIYTPEHVSSYEETDVRDEIRNVLRYDCRDISYDEVRSLMEKEYGVTEYTVGYTYVSATGEINDTTMTYYNVKKANGCDIDFIFDNEGVLIQIAALSTKEGTYYYSYDLNSRIYSGPVHKTGSINAAITEKANEAFPAGMTRTDVMSRMELNGNAGNCVANETNRVSYQVVKDFDGADIDFYFDEKDNLTSAEAWTR